MKYRPTAAINHMRGLSGFQKSFNQVLYKTVQGEVKKGCRSMSETGPRTCTMESIDNFKPDDYYENQVFTFPTLMTSLAAVVTNKKSSKDGVKVVS